MRVVIDATRVTIAGNDSADPEVRVVRGDRSLDVVSYDHTVIVFRVPPGESAHNNLTVTVFNQVSNAVLFTYNPPVITELQDASGAPLAYGSCCRWVCCCVLSLLLSRWCFTLYLTCFSRMLSLQHEGRLPDPHRR